MGMTTRTFFFSRGRRDTKRRCREGQLRMMYGSAEVGSVVVTPALEEQGRDWCLAAAAKW